MDPICVGVATKLCEVVSVLSGYGAVRFPMTTITSLLVPLSVEEFSAVEMRLVRRAQLTARASCSGTSESPYGFWSKAPTFQI